MTRRQAIATIQECVEHGRVQFVEHFTTRLAQRGLFWADVLAIIEQCAHAREDGLDEFGRPRWLLRGQAADDLTAELLAVLDHDDRGNIVVFITIYFED